MVEKCSSLLIATDHKPLVEKLEDKEVKKSGEYESTPGPWFIKVAYLPEDKNGAAGFYTNNWPPQYLRASPTLKALMSHESV